MQVAQSRRLLRRKVLEKTVGKTAACADEKEKPRVAPDPGPPPAVGAKNVPGWARTTNLPVNGRTR